MKNLEIRFVSFCRDIRLTGLIRLQNSVKRFFRLDVLRSVSAVLICRNMLNYNIFQKRGDFLRQVAGLLANDKIFYLFAGVLDNSIFAQLHIFRGVTSM